MEAITVTKTLLIAIIVVDGENDSFLLLTATVILSSSSSSYCCPISSPSICGCEFEVCVLGISFQLMRWDGSPRWKDPTMLPLLESPVTADPIH
jgi:hypothetical protein